MVVGTHKIALSCNDSSILFVGEYNIVSTSEFQPKFVALSAKNSPFGNNITISGTNFEAESGSITHFELIVTTYLIYEDILVGFRYNTAKSTDPPSVIVDGTVLSDSIITCAVPPTISVHPVDIFVCFYHNYDTLHPTPAVASVSNNLWFVVNRFKISRQRISQLY